MAKDAKIVGRKEWVKERLALLEKEKAYQRAGDELSDARRALPRVKLDEDFVFEGVDGDVKLSDLFEGRSQLIIQHFMFGPDWEAGCPSCSFWADGYDPMIVHMNQRDVSFAVVSQGPIDKLQAYRKRMGWNFTWVSSFKNNFNISYGASASAEQIEAGKMRYNYVEVPVDSTELPVISVFERDVDGALYHTYSTYARGLDRMNAAYAYIDLTPKGRNEDDLPYGMAWVKRHDEY